MGIGSLLRIPFFRTREHGNGHTPEIAGIGHRNAVAALQDVGFWVVREGTHVVMTNGVRIVTIPCQDPVNALTMDGVVRDAGLSPDQFRQLL